MIVIAWHENHLSLTIPNSDLIADPLATFVSLAASAGYNVTLEKKLYPGPISGFVEVSTVSSVKAVIFLLETFLRCDIKFITLKKLLNEK